MARSAAPLVLRARACPARSHVISARRDQARSATSAGWRIQRHEHAGHVREVVERRQVGDVRVVDVPALVADDREELLVGVVIDERRVHHDERVVVRAERAGVEDGAVDDEDLRHARSAACRTPCFVMRWMRGNCRSLTFTACRGADACPICLNRRTLASTASATGFVFSKATRDCRSKVYVYSWPVVSAPPPARSAFLRATKPSKSSRGACAMDRLRLRKLSLSTWPRSASRRALPNRLRGRSPVTDSSVAAGDEARLGRAPPAARRDASDDHAGRDGHARADEAPAWPRPASRRVARARAWQRSAGDRSRPRRRVAPVERAGRTGPPRTSRRGAPPGAAPGATATQRAHRTPLGVDARRPPARARADVGARAGRRGRRVDATVERPARRHRSSRPTRGRRPTVDDERVRARARRHDGRRGGDRPSVEPAPVGSGRIERERRPRRDAADASSRRRPATRPPSSASARDPGALGAPRRRRGAIAAPARRPRALDLGHEPRRLRQLGVRAEQRLRGRERPIRAVAVARRRSRRARARAAPRPRPATPGRPRAPARASSRGATSSRRAPAPSSRARARAASAGRRDPDERRRRVGRHVRRGSLGALGLLGGAFLAAPSGPSPSSPARPWRPRLRRGEGLGQDCVDVPVDLHAPPDPRDRAVGSDEERRANRRPRPSCRTSSSRPRRRRPVRREVGVAEERKADADLVAERRSGSSPSPCDTPTTVGAQLLQARRWPRVKSCASRVQPGRVVLRIEVEDEPLAREVPERRRVRPRRSRGRTSGRLRAHI